MMTKIHDSQMTSKGLNELRFQIWPQDGRLPLLPTPFSGAICHAWDNIWWVAFINLLRISSLFVFRFHRPFAFFKITSSNGTFSVLLVTGGFPSQRPVTRSFAVLFYLRLNKRLSKQLTRRWSETPSRSLWCPCNDENISGSFGDSWIMEIMK